MQKNWLKKTREPSSKAVIVSPADGKIIPLSEVEDEVFSAGILGDGIGLLPDGGEIYAPVDGVIATITETKHAVSITADCGAEILIHCGIDTVGLRGEGFDLFVSVGERITPGKLLLKFDSSLIQNRGYATTTPIVVVNSDAFELSFPAGERVRRGEALIRLSKK